MLAAQIPKDHSDQRTSGFIDPEAKHWANAQIMIDKP